MKYFGITELTEKHTCRIPGYQVRLGWTAAQPESRAVLIENALKKVHKLETPPATSTYFCIKDKKRKKLD